MLCKAELQMTKNQTSDKRTYMVSEIASLLGISTKSKVSTQAWAGKAGARIYVTPKCTGSA